MIDNTISLGIQILVLILSIITTYKSTTMNSIEDTINIIVVNLDKTNRYLRQTLYLNINPLDTFNLSIGHKLNHYAWHYDTKLLFLYVKPHEYDNNMIHESRIRKLILSHIIYPIKIREIYKRGV